MKYKLYCFPNISNDNNKPSNKKNDMDKKREFYPLQFDEKKNSAVAFITNDQGALDDREKNCEIEQAYLKGLEEGKKEGHKSEKKVFESALNHFHQAISKFDTLKKQVYQTAERETVELALAIARKIILYEVSIQKELILRVVKEAIKKVADHDKIEIRINPTDSPIIKNADLQLLNCDAIENITFIEDETISPGGCIIETNCGNIDARIEKQLQAIEEVFRFEFQQSEMNH
jgi:flagellar biosynthesis/type III secretory pathway protein FliH